MIARVEVTAAGWAQLWVHGVCVISGWGQDEKEKLDAKAAELNAAAACVMASDESKGGT